MDLQGMRMRDSVPENAMRDQSGKSRQQRRKDLFQVLVVGVPFLGVIGSMLIGPVVVMNVDKGHRGWIECTVTDAKGGKAAGNRRGHNRYWQVLVETSDCGTLKLREGITEANNQDVAAELAPGGRFRFEIGEATRKIRWLTDPISVIPKVWTFQRMD
ncbi:hypothetical protein N2K95_01955 [Arthrobacter zhaoxinii]|uniref:Uncharacterized protein n=1 Tax=Arthrobacter zhaoxinii TaxID=2964616 RepID=A0ABY5YQX2_9MICC|nr:hypothetical protein [Arthrobacter zhaoxinii]UWX97482.1 hypothetical protein N2K95_01955 [Arthrobacter zhaoxinii]